MKKGSETITIRRSMIRMNPANIKNHTDKEIELQKKNLRKVGFLGGKANVSHAGAMFAVKCGSPVVVAAMGREGRRHVFHHLATLRPDSSTDAREEARRLTAEAMRIIDAHVRSHPRDWFWYNKRWILQPV